MGYVWLLSEKVNNETYYVYEKMHSYSTNLALQFSNHINTANADMYLCGFLSDAVELKTQKWEILYSKENAE